MRKFLFELRIRFFLFIGATRIAKKMHIRKSEEELENLDQQASVLEAKSLINPDDIRLKLAATMARMLINTARIAINFNKKLLEKEKTYKNENK